MVVLITQTFFVTFVVCIELAYNPQEWRLFVDSSKFSLKAVLLHNGNQFPSIPVGHAVGMKETYDTMAKLLQLINYEAHNWSVCCDLKVVALLTGLQGGYTKYCCFLCLWNSRDRVNHYVKKEWPKRENFKIGENNVCQTPLVSPENIILPPFTLNLD